MVPALPSDCALADGAKMIETHARIKSPRRESNDEHKRLNTMTLPPSNMSALQKGIHANWTAYTRLTQPNESSGGRLSGRSPGRIERAAVVGGVRVHLDHGVPCRNRKRRELDSAYGMQDRKMPSVASRATMVVGPAMLIRVNFHRARRLNGGETHQ